LFSIRAKIKNYTIQFRQEMERCSHVKSVEDESNSNHRISLFDIPAGEAMVKYG
jgi:hypothetical protein